MRRLLLVNAHGSDPTEGGTEKHLRRLARLLPEQGIEVLIVAAFQERTPPNAPTLTLHPGHPADSRMRRARNVIDDTLARRSRRLERILADAAPDLVHTHNLPGVTTAVWDAAARVGIPVVHTLHDYHLLCPRMTLLRPDGEACRPHPLLCGLRSQRMMRHAAAVSDVVAVSQHLLVRHAAFFPSARRHVVRNPFEPPADVAGAPPPGPRLAVLGYIGKLDRTKGVDRLLEAVPDLARMGVRLRIAGDGKLRARVAAAAQRGDVDFDGVVSGARKAAFLVGCDAGIMPSVWEEPGGPTNAMLDWLAVGRPMLASTRGGLGEATGRIPGTIALDPTVAGITSTVTRLASPESWRNAVSSVAPVARGQDEDRWVGEHLEVYRRALTRSGPEHR